MTDFLSQQPSDSSIAALFATLWLAAESWTPSERATAALPGQTFEDAVRMALSIADEKSACTSIYHAWEKPASSLQHYRGQVLAIMRLIDHTFYSIHPRTGHRTPSRSPHSRITSWLSDARETRAVFGAYFESDTHRLIARGPLSRSSRQPIANNADTLADRFCALELVRKTLDHAGRSIAIRHTLIPADAMRGVRPSAAAGSEKIVFIPVAEDAPDISKSHIRRGGNDFVDFRMSNSIDVAGRITSALAKSSTSDIVLVPELVVSEEDADKIAEHLLESGTSHRMVISGSGQTRQTIDEQPWNEARVLNGFGVELWRQRKVWPAGITRDLALRYGLPDPGDGQIFEDTASGHDITVIDTDGLGRCIILICQDLQARPVADDLIRQYQPDWVFVPIMDCGASVERWAHRRSLELSTLSQARFLISSSLSLAKVLEIVPLPPCGLAVGPSNPASSSSEDAEDGDRLVKEAFVDASSKPTFATLVWRSIGWKKTFVISK